jgi:hypothetical protein
MSTSKVREAMLAKGHTVKPSWLTIIMYNRSLRHVDMVLSNVEGTDNCLRALAADATTNMWVAKHLAQAVDYTNIVVQGIPDTLDTQDYTDIRNKLRHLSYALLVLLYVQKSLQVFDRARLKVYTAALSWNKEVDRELFSDSVIQSKILASKLAEMYNLIDDIIIQYRIKLKELKHAHRSSK